MSDKDPDLRRNAPKLELHVPEPPFRPGDTPDFSSLKIPPAGSAQRPDTSAAASDTHPLTIDLVRHTHPRFLRTDVRWLPIAMSDAEAKQRLFDEDDARLSVARSYEYPDWARLEAHVTATADASSQVGRFERAVDAVITGDVDALRSSLETDPALVRARSVRVTVRDPPIHEATLIVFRAEADKWFESSRAVKATRPDQQGQWRLRALPPGDYLAVALDYVEDGAWNDPDYLESLRRYATPFTVTEGASQTVAVKLTVPK